jgi:hypothetical protein
LVLMTPYKRFGPNIARAETRRRMARLACWLEEYRLAHGQYSDDLGQLSGLPPHLNQEVLSEAPLHYQRKDAGYTLYSTGWEQKDDGGVIGSSIEKGNCVWRQF